MPESSEVSAPRSLLRRADLVVAAVYEREVEASLSGVWENVYDWEHLPWLHGQAFTSIRLIESGAWGWCAEIGFPGGGLSTVELVTDREAGCYVARTISGAGAPSEIWTSLRPSGEATQIRVEFCVSPLPEETLAVIGKAYLAGYAQLWDQDEGMMQARASRRTSTDRPPNPSGSELARPVDVHLDVHLDIHLDLGLASDLRQRVPMRFEFAGSLFRLIEKDGVFLAHSTECPHWGGPLSECDVDQGEITCPWHGYRFEVAEGRSSDGRNLRLRPAPRIVFDAASDRLTAMR